MSNLDNTNLFKQMSYSPPPPPVPPPSPFRKCGYCHSTTKTGGNCHNCGAPPSDPTRQKYSSIDPEDEPDDRQDGCLWVLNGVFIMLLFVTIIAAMFYASSHISNTHNKPHPTMPYSLSPHDADTYKGMRERHVTLVAQTEDLFDRHARSMEGRWTELEGCRVRDWNMINLLGPVICQMAGSIEESRKNLVAFLEAHNGYAGDDFFNVHEPVAQ